MRNSPHSNSWFGCSGDRARAFYGGLLGLEERDVPPKLDPAQLIWFRVGGDLELHLFESDETPPRSQHFCLRVAPAGSDARPENPTASGGGGGVDELRRTLEDAGVETHDTAEIVGRPRFFCRDPFGNRVELTEWMR